MANYVEYIKVAGGESWQVRDAAAHTKIDSLETTAFPNTGGQFQGSITFINNAGMVLGDLKFVMSSTGVPCIAWTDANGTARSWTAQNFCDAVANSMPKTGGTFTGNAVAYETARTTRGIFNEETRSDSPTGTLQSVKYFINQI